MFNPVDAWKVIDSAVREVRSYKEKKRDNVKAASSLISAVYNKGRYFEYTYFAVRNAAIPQGQLELHQAYHSLEQAIYEARSNDYVRARCEMGRKYLEGQQKAMLKYGIVEQSNGTFHKLREKDLAFDLIIMDNSADWMASVIGLPNSGGGPQISQSPYNDIREARGKMMYEWLRGHGVEMPRLPSD